jgi:hypothetical protein
MSILKDEIINMGSIASTLNSINGSLLNEISNFSTPQVASSTSGASAITSAGTSSSDTVNFSEFAQLFQQLSQLQTSNPAEFTKVTSDAAAQLQQAAKQSTDPAQASFLSSLATQFQQASQTGNLSPFDNGTQGASGHHHGHHHHHGGGSSPENTSAQDGTSAPDPLTALLSNASSTSNSDSQNPSTDSSS